MRVPGSKSMTGKPGPPVFMQHGIMANADSFILNKPDVTPAFAAVNAGYDVWLGNSRGNNYSTKHVSLDMKKDAEKYWDFGWEEMGKYDLPASLDYVSKESGSEKIAYLGHSQGTT